MEWLKARNLESRYNEIKANVFNRVTNIENEIMLRDIVEVDEDEVKFDYEGENSAIAALRSKEMALLENLKKEHRAAIRRLKVIHVKAREQIRLKQNESLKAILALKAEGNTVFLLDWF
jgi:hypothetical protein